MLINLNISPLCEISETGICDNLLNRFTRSNFLDKTF